MKAIKRIGFGLKTKAVDGLRAEARMREGSSGNVLSMNSLMQNQENAYDDGTNQWDNGSKGNYYDNNACRDSNKDGICEAQFKIPGGSSIDRYPLAKSAA